MSIYNPYLNLKTQTKKKSFLTTKQTTIQQTSNIEVNSNNIKKKTKQKKILHKNKNTKKTLKKNNLWIIPKLTSNTNKANHSQKSFTLLKKTIFLWATNWILQMITLEHFLCKILFKEKVKLQKRPENHHHEKQKWTVLKKRKTKTILKVFRNWRNHSIFQNEKIQI